MDSLGKQPSFQQMRSEVEIKNIWKEIDWRGPKISQHSSRNPGLCQIIFLLRQHIVISAKRISLLSIIFFIGKIICYYHHRMFCFILIWFGRHVCPPLSVSRNDFAVKTHMMTQTQWVFQLCLKHLNLSKRIET